MTTVLGLEKNASECKVQKTKRKEDKRKQNQKERKLVIQNQMPQERNEVKRIHKESYDIKERKKSKIFDWRVRKEWNDTEKIQENNNKKVKMGSLLQLLPWFLFLPIMFLCWVAE